MTFVNAMNLFSDIREIHADFNHNGTVSKHLNYTRGDFKLCYFLLTMLDKRFKICGLINANVRKSQPNEGCF